MHISAIVTLNAHEAISYVAASADEREIALLNVTCPASIAIAQQLISAPAYHLTLSFRYNENPAFAQVQKIAARVLELLGLAGACAFIAMHRGRDHPHAHVIADAGGAGLLSISHPELEAIAQHVEREFGLRRR